MLALVFILLSLAPFYSPLAQVAGDDRTEYGYIGESVTLSCSEEVYFDWPIIWYRGDNFNRLSTNGRIESTTMADRLSVECQRDQHVNTLDICRLTINPVTLTDRGSYHCGYHGHTYVYFGHVVLNVGYGILPSEDSPFCKTLTEANGGGYVQINEYSMGDNIYLKCLVNSVSISPSFVWTRNPEVDTFPLTQPTKGRSLRTRLITLDEKDVGAVFTCSMTHPGLSETRTCSITPLPAPPTTPKLSTQTPIPNTTTRLVSRPSEYMTTAEKGHIIGNQVTDSKTTANSQLFLLPIIIAIIVLIVATVVIVLAIFLIKRRKKHIANPSKPNYESYDQDRSTSAEYAVVNTHGSIDKANKCRVSKKTQQESTVVAERSSTGTIDITDGEEAFPLYAKPDKRKRSNDFSVDIDDSNVSTTAAAAAVNAPDSINKLKNTQGNPPEKSNVAESGSSGTAYEDDACLLYAQPHKRKKSNDLNAAVIVEEHNRYDNSLSHQPSDQPKVVADPDGLMYADLDLIRAPDSDDARMPSSSPDATVYADIKRAL